jgi:hypothetical protein
MFKKYRKYNYIEPWNEVVWTWRQVLFIKWGYKRSICYKLPRHVNCRCVTILYDRTIAVMGKG